MKVVEKVEEVQKPEAESKKKAQSEIKPEEFIIEPSRLPSRGKFYSAPIHAKRLNAIQMKNLSKMTSENADIVLDSIFSKSLDIKTKSILKADKLWLLYYLRAITYDDYPCKVSCECGVCGEKFSGEYRLNNLDVIYLSEQPGEVELPNGTRIGVKFPTIADEQASRAILDNKNFIETVDSDILAIATYIDTINGKKVGAYEAYLQLVTSPDSASIYSKLLTYLKKIVCGARPVCNTTCPSCGSSVQTSITLDQSFFLPDFE